MDPYSKNRNGISLLLVFSSFRERLRRAGHGQFLQVVHEDLQADVICKDRGSCLLQLQRKQEGDKISGWVFNSSSYPDQIIQLVHAKTPDTLELWKL